MRRACLAFLLLLGGCGQSQDSGVQTVRAEKFGVVLEKTAPREVIVNDTYEVRTEVK